MADSGHGTDGQDKPVRRACPARAGPARSAARRRPERDARRAPAPHAGTGRPVRHASASARPGAGPGRSRATASGAARKVAGHAGVARAPQLPRRHARGRARLDLRAARRHPRPDAALLPAPAGRDRRPARPGQRAAPRGERPPEGAGPLERRRLRHAAGARAAQVRQGRREVLHRDRRQALDQGAAGGRQGAGRLERPPVVRPALGVGAGRRRRPGCDRRSQGGAGTTGTSGSTGTAKTGSTTSPAK